MFPFPPKSVPTASKLESQDLRGRKLVGPMAIPLRSAMCQRELVKAAEDAKKPAIGMDEAKEIRKNYVLQRSQRLQS